MEKTIADVVGNMPGTDRKWSRTAAVKANYPSAQKELYETNDMSMRSFNQCTNIGVFYDVTECSSSVTIVT